MSTTLFKRSTATAAAFAAIGSAGALSLPAAGAATIHPAASQSAHAVQGPQQPSYWCGEWHKPYWCYPGYPPNVYPDLVSLYLYSE